jgi:hypothetical protein
MARTDCNWPVRHKACPYPWNKLESLIVSLKMDLFCQLQTQSMDKSFTEQPCPVVGKL